MPLAQAAPRIGSERPPSMACAGSGPVSSGCANGARRPIPTENRGRTNRACDLVVRFVKGRRRRAEGALHSSSIACAPRRLRVDDPSAENRRPAGAGSRGLGTPLFRLRGRRLEGNLLRQTGRNHSRRSRWTCSHSDQVPDAIPSRRFGPDNPDTDCKRLCRTPRTGPADRRPVTPSCASS